MSNFYHTIKGIYLMLVLCALSNLTVQSQSLFPQIIACTGGYQSNAAGSLSFTIGETNTQTLTSGTHMLTQGFQQPFELNLLNVKAFLQGFYAGSGQMQDVLFNQGEYATPSTVADSIMVELHDAASPYALSFQTKAILQQNGTITIKGLGAVGQSYYIVLKHRNSIETWSANPVLLQANTSYDFSTAAAQAFGDNQFEVEPNIFALFAGDINQDGVIDNSDFSLWESDANDFLTGYLGSDIDGNGSVDNSDFSVWEANANGFVSVVIP